MRVLYRIVRHKKRERFSQWITRVFAGNRFDVLLKWRTVSSSCFVSPYPCLHTSFAFPVLINRVYFWINGTGRMVIIDAVWSKLWKTAILLKLELSAKVRTARLNSVSACGTQILRNGCLHVYSSSMDLSCTVFSVRGSECVVTDSNWKGGK